MEPTGNWVVFYEDSTVEVRSYKMYHHAREMARVKNETEKRRYPNPAHQHLVQVCHRDFYYLYVVHREMRRHLLSREMFETWSNTPYYLCPSSETYHS